jgi:5'-nucleotidase
MQKIILTILFTSFIIADASAKLIQIIHTNDLHSYFEGVRSGKGGYARIKTLADKLRAEAALNGIPTLYLDGGDFGEGSSYYFSNNGEDAISALDHLGVDATVLGNHDYILGGEQLSKQMTSKSLKTPILSANITGKSKMGLVDLLPDYKDFDLQGLKVRVFGLSTPEIHFQYPLKPFGKVSKSHSAGIRMANLARRDGVDFTIALTHTGVKADEALAEKTRTVGLIVGGHDHIRLEQPRMVTNLNGYQVPILQAGANSTAMGSLIIDIDDEGHATIKNYQLHNITKDIPQDLEMENFVLAAKSARSSYFERTWEEIIGFTEIVLTGDFEGNIRDGRSCWSRHIANMTRKHAETDLAVQFDLFMGQEIQPGPVTFGDMIDNFPHFRQWKDKGWKIARARVNGFVFKKLLNYLAVDKNQISITIDGLDAEIESEGKGGKMSTKLVPFVIGEHYTYQARINGWPLTNMSFYSIALPSEVPYGMSKVSKFITHLLLRKLEYLDDSDYWPLLEDYIRKNSPLQCLDESKLVSN